MIRIGLNELALGFVVLFGTVAAASASQLPVETIPLVSCRETIGYDVGSLYTVQYDAVHGSYQVEMARNSIIGPRPVYTTRARLLSSGIAGRMVLAYALDEQQTLREKLVFSGMNTERPTLQVFRNEVEIRSSFVCEKHAETPRGLPSVRPVCLAYFEGYVFNDQAGTCVRIGRSGCSNPFEFRTLNKCLDAAKEADLL